MTFKFLFFCNGFFESFFFVSNIVDDFIKLALHGSQQIIQNHGLYIRDNKEFLKYENVNADNIKETLQRIIGIYHTRRPHLSLGMLTPEQVHNGEMPGRKLWKKYYLKDSA